MPRRKTPIDDATALTRAITRGAKQPATDDVRDMVRTLETALGSKKAVAERLGVSPRTVERWVTSAGQQRKPSGSTLDKMRDAVRTAPELRRQALSPRREARIRNKGSYVRMSATIGATSPIPGGQDLQFSGRPRTIGGDADRPLHLDADHMSAILDAYLAGDDEGIRDVFQDALGDAYYGSVEWQDVTGLEFLRDYDGEQPEI